LRSSTESAWTSFFWPEAAMWRRLGWLGGHRRLPRRRTSSLGPSWFTCGGRATPAT
jgi:hypothetical protein